MSTFLAEPPWKHDQARRIGVLLLNLGTPEAPTAKAVRRYLAEFLSDHRVVEIPGFIWKPILHLAVLPVRPGRSAKKYAMIWGADGSPLLTHSQKQKTLLLGYLGQRLRELGLPSDVAPVELAMSYGKPGIAEALTRLRTVGCDRVLAVPLFPQYSSSATAAALDSVFAQVQRMRRMPSLRTIDGFHDDAGYVRALARNVNDYWMRHGRPERLVLSFHGLPRRSLDRGDPYHCQCQKTARLLATELGLDATQYLVTFQSRFGRTEWLKPYTRDTLVRLAKDGLERVDVFCPGFVSDCLETLEEIGIEAKQAFLRAGGREFHAIPCLNEHPAWIGALVEIVVANLQGWLAPLPDAPARELSLLRATTMGAKE